VRAKAAERFGFRSQDLANAIGKRLSEYETALRGGVGLFVSSDGVTRREWHEYVTQLRLSTTFPGIQGMGYSKMMPAQAVEKHIADIRAEGFPDYQVKPPGLRDPTSAIIYLEPFDWRNQRAFGYDMFSEAVRRAAMVRAMESGEPALSGRVTLVQETEKDVQYGFLMYLPVYRPGMPTESAEQRRAAIDGFVYAPFRMRDLLDGILGLDNIRLEFEIYDGAAAGRDKLMFDSVTLTGGEPRFHALLGEQHHSFGVHKSFTLEIAQHSWTLFVHAMGTGDESGEELLPTVVAGSGIAIDIFLFIIISSLGRRKLEIERVVDQRDQLTKIDQSSRHLLEVINDVLDISRIEAGHLSLQLAPFRIDGVIRHLDDLMGGQAAAKGLRLVFDLPPALRGQTVIGDAGHLNQVFINLVGNAIKFSDKGEIVLRARVLDDSSGRLMVRWEVSDQGIGIPAEAQPRLFDAFEQADNSMTRQYGGTGLGLAIARRLVHLMGGEIGVISAPGAGSTFWLTTPFDQVAQDAVPPAPTFQDERMAERLRSEFFCTRVLLVEDEPVNREVVREQLEELDFVVDTAADGQQAVDLARGSEYALILMDLQMPRLNGFDATRAIRTLPGYADVPILAMTANAFEEDRAACLAAGMDDHLAKPFTPPQLQATLLKWLARDRP